MKLSIVIPILNEEETINELYSRMINSLRDDFKKFDYEIIFIDDGSKDKSFDILKSIHKKNNKVKIIQFSRHFGHHIAITAGLDIASGNFIVMMDGDLQDKPEEIIKLYKKINEGYDVVYAVRKNKKFSYYKKMSSNIFNFVIKKLIDEEIVINSTIFRIITKQALIESNKLREQNRYLVGIFGWIGFKHGAQEVNHGERFKGETKYTLSKQIELAFNAIFAYSSFPLFLAMKISLILFFVALLITASLIYSKLTTNMFEAWKITLIAIILIGGIQTLFLGLIGTYLGRLYIENKKRPLYITKQIIA